MNLGKDTGLVMNYEEYLKQNYVAIGDTLETENGTKYILANYKDEEDVLVNLSNGEIINNIEIRSYYELKNGITINGKKLVKIHKSDSVVIHFQ